MSSLRSPGLGPIVGHTTPTSSTIWIRASDRADVGGKHADDRRTIGLLTIELVNGQPATRDLQGVYYFRLHRKCDRTGMFTLGGDHCLTHAATDPRPPIIPLAPNTRYRVRVGTLALDDSFDTDQNIPDSSLADLLPDPRRLRDQLLRIDGKRATAEFWTFPHQRQDRMSFMLGSCRYPGLLSKAKEADEIFEAILAEARGPEQRDRAQMVLMVGDQIYADKLNRNIPIGLADTFEEFQDRYQSAFGSRNMRALLREMPTYMILDDHEIEDNWAQDRIDKPPENRAHSRKVFNLAIAAYRSYQWTHGPRTYPNRLYYQFCCGGYPFFVLDTRTQRFMEHVPDSLTDNRLLGRTRHVDRHADAEGEPSQVERLEKWLADSQAEHGDVPKFIVTSSVFAPNPMSARTGRLNDTIPITETRPPMVKWIEASDSWPSFPETRRRLLRFVIDHGIQNVVFLSGDIHCANVAQITLKDNDEELPLKMASITSSAFYWPFPFADGDPSDYVHDSTDQNQRDTFRISETETMDYRSWNYTQEDNFCRVDIDRANHRLVVTPFDKKGRQVCKTNWFGMYDENNPLISVLELASW